MTDRLAVVVGAAHGMGEAVARRLGSDGISVIAADLDIEAAEATANAVIADGGSASAAQVDVSSSASVEALANLAAAQAPVQILVNTAGILIKEDVIDMSDDQWRRVHEINLDGSFFIGRAFGRIMREQGAGSMIFIASDRGVYGGAGVSAYASSKGGVIALVKSLALELGRFGVTVNAINPGTTETRLARAGGEDFLNKRRSEDPLGRLSQPEEIAGLVSYLAGDGQFITGQLVSTRMRVG
jgi:NAD(P)-dependent dehydrogenase (short-subunit alcohol dehydrogenase family)